MGRRSEYEGERERYGQGGAARKSREGGGGGGAPDVVGILPCAGGVGGGGGDGGDRPGPQGRRRLKPRGQSPDRRPWARRAAPWLQPPFRGRWTRRGGPSRVRRPPAPSTVFHSRRPSRAAGLGCGALGGDAGPRRRVAAGSLRCTLGPSAAAAARAVYGRCRIDGAQRLSILH